VGKSSGESAQERLKSLSKRESFTKRQLDVSQILSPLIVSINIKRTYGERRGYKVTCNRKVARIDEGEKALGERRES